MSTLTDALYELLGGYLTALENADAFSKRAGPFNAVDDVRSIDQLTVDELKAVEAAARKGGADDRQLTRVLTFAAGYAWLEMSEYFEATKARNMRPAYDQKRMRIAQLKKVSDEQRATVKKCDKDLSETIPVKTRRYSYIAEKTGLGHSTVREIVEGVKHDKKKRVRKQT